MMQTWLQQSDIDMFLSATVLAVLQTNGHGRHHRSNYFVSRFDVQLSSIVVSVMSSHRVSNVELAACQLETC